MVGPCSLDLVRCSTSILLAAEVWGLSPIQAMRMVLGYLDSYRATIAEAAGGHRDGRVSLADERPDRELLGDCASGTQAKLLDHVTRVDKSGAGRSGGPTGKFPPIGKRKAAAVAEAVEAYGRAMGRADVFRVLDVSARVAGIGSLGVRRYVALVAGDGSPDGQPPARHQGGRPVVARSAAPRARRPTAWTDDARGSSTPSDGSRRSRRRAWT